MKIYKLQIFTLVFMSFILGCSEFIIVGILSEIADSLKISVVQAGRLVTIFALIYAIVTPVITTVLGRFSKYLSLIAFTLIFITGNLLSFFSGNYTMFLISRIITAVVSGPMISLGLTFANTIAPAEQRPKVISFVFSGFSIASVFGVPLGTWISGRIGWPFAFLAIVICSLMVLALMVLTLPKTGSEKPAGMGDSLKILKDSRIQIGLLLPMFSAAGFYVFYTYLNPIITEVLHYSLSSVSVFLFAFGITSIASNLLSGTIAEKSGIRKLHYVYIGQTLIFFSLYLLLQSKILGTSVIMLLGVSMYLLNSPIQMFYFQVAEKDYPESVVFASSFNSIFFNFGISMGSFVGSLIVDHAGLPYVGIGGGVLAVITTMLLLFLNNITYSRSSAVFSPGKIPAQSR